MKNSEKVRQQAESEIDKWTDPRFANVDMVGHATGRDYARSKVGGYDDVDPRFAPLDTRGSFKSLRNAVEDLARDPNVRERIALETGNAGELAEFVDEQAEGEAYKFRANNPGYLPTDANWTRMVQCMAYNYLNWQDCSERDADDCYQALLQRGLFIEPNLTAIFRELQRAGSLEVAASEAKALSQSEQLGVIALAKAGRLDDAIGTYLTYAFPAADEVWIDCGEFLADPETVAVRNEAVRFVWLNSRVHAQDSREWRQFQRSFFTNKPCISLADLDAAWAAFERYQKDYLRSSVLEQVNEPAQTGNLDELTDDSVSQLYRGTMKHIARTSSGTGMLI